MSPGPGLTYFSLSSKNVDDSTFSLTTSSVSSQSLSSNTTKFINKHLRKNKNTSVINNQVNLQKIQQRAPSKRVHQGHPNLLYFDLKISLPIRRNLMLIPLPNSKQQQRQMQYNQKAKCHQDKEHIIKRVLSHLRDTKLFAYTHVDESRQTGNIRTLTQIQRQEGQDLGEEVPTIEKTALPHEPDLTLLDDSSCGKDLNIKFLTQVGGEPIYNTDIVDENTIILSNNVKSQILNNSLNTISSSSKKVQPPTKNPNNNKKAQLEFSHDKKTSLRQEQELSTQSDKNQTHLDIDLDILTTTDFNYLHQASEKVSRYEDLVPIEPSENLKKLKSIQKSSAKKCVATNSSPKYSKHNKPYSPIQNSEIDLIVDATKNRVSYCSSCSSSNSCNCDITGDNSNTLYEGFGIGVVVGSSYSDDHITGICDIVSLSSVSNSPTSVLPSFGSKTNKNLYGQKRYKAEHPANFDGREENDHTESAFDICSDFDEICSEPSSLREDLSRTETENKILSNNLKNYSKFHDKLDKEIQKQRLPINSDLSTNSYRIENCFHRCKDQCHKSSIEHNIFVSCSNNSINYNTMNFDAAKKTDLQNDVLTRSGFGINNEGVEVQNCAGRIDADHNEHNNLYGGAGGIPNIPETMNGTTICGATTGAGGNQQKAAGGTTQKRAQRRGGKQQPDRPERALFCLSLKNPVRAFCIRIVDSKYPFSKLAREKHTSTHLLIRCIGNLYSCIQ